MTISRVARWCGLKYRESSMTISRAGRRKQRKRSGSTSTLGDTPFGALGKLEAKAIVAALAFRSRGCVAEVPKDAFAPAVVELGVALHRVQLADGRGAS